MTPDHDPTDPDHPRPSADEQTCPATTAEGRPCRGTPMGSGWCFAHDPNLADQRAEARARGGRNRSTVARGRARIPNELADVVARLEEALTETHTGNLEPDRARAMASLANAIVRARESFDVEVRLGELEAGLEEAAQRERVLEEAAPRPAPWKAAS